MERIIQRTVDVSDGLMQEKILEPLALEDALAHVFRITVEEDGSAADLSGCTAFGYFIRPTSDTVMITGTISGNTAEITLPAACYAYIGPCQLMIRLVHDETKTSLYCAYGQVIRSRTDPLIDPGTPIPDIEDIIAIVERCEAAAASAEQAASVIAGLNADTIGAVSFSSQQSLSNAQKETARQNIGLDQIDQLVTGTVKYSEAQTLTDSQKSQARQNIGAPAETRVTSIETAISAIQTALSNVGNAVVDIIRTASGDGILITYADGTTKTITFDISGGMPIDDWEYDANHYLHLYDENGEDLLEPILIEGGGGGSGGGSGSLRLSYVTPSAVTIVYHDPCVIQVGMTATDADGDTIGSGIGTWYVGGLPVAQNWTIRDGNNNTFDISQYLAPGSNEVRLQVSVDSNGTTITKSKAWQVQAVNMYFSWEYDDSRLNDTAYTDRWTVYGADISKTTHTMLDGVELDTLVTTRSNYQQSMIIPMQAHGAHSVERWLTAEIAGEPKTTEHQYHEMIFVQDGNTTPIVAISMAAQTIDMYDTIIIPVVVYDPAAELADADLLVDGVQIGSWEDIDRTVQRWAYTPTTPGEHVLSVRCGSVMKSVTITANEVTLDVSEVTGYDVRFKSSEMASNASVRNWSSNGHGASFSSGFDWVNGGLHTETVDGVPQQYMAIKAGDRMTIDYQPWATDPRGSGMTIKVIFKVANCRDYDAVAISCMANNVGMQLNAHNATMRGSATETLVQYAEDDYIELEFDIKPMMAGNVPSNQRYLQAYVDGVLSTCVPYSDETFVQQTPQSIVIGSDDCDVLLYMLKVYPFALTADNHVDNFIMDAPNASELTARYSRNNIINQDTGEIDYQLLQDAAPDLRIWLLDIPYMTNGKKDKVKNCQFHQRWKNGDRYYQMDGTGTLTVQGTSSVNYIRGAANTDISITALTDGDGNNLLANGVVDEDHYGKNLFYSEDGSTVKIFTPAEALAATQEVDEEAETPGIDFVPVSRDSQDNVTGYIRALGLKVSDTSCPITYSNTKVNFASCEQINNMANAQCYERFQPFPSRTVRDCMEFSMGVQFIRDNNSAEHLPDETHFVLFGDDRYHLYSIGNMGNSKKNVHVFHDLSNPNEVCIENKDNTSPRQRMIDDDLTAAEWGEEFECRYPDTDTPSQEVLAAWQRLLTWMATRNPAAHTDEALDTPETYGAYTFVGHSRAIPASDGIHNYAQVLRGTTVSQYAGTYTHDTFERRMARMLSECEDYLVMDSFVYQFLFLERHTCVDNVAKNSFWTSSDLIHWDVSKAYDMDTSDGNNNNGEMVFDYGNEYDARYTNKYDPDAGLQTVFNAANSVWFIFVANLYEACRTMYINREALGAWSAQQYHAYLSAEQKKVPERVWNQVYWYSYLRPAETGITTNWLKFLAEGCKRHQRAHFEYFQEQYISSKYRGNVASANRFYFRAEEVSSWAESVPPKGEITLKMYNKMYTTVTVGDLVYHRLAAKGETVVVDFSDVTMSNTVINVYSAPMVQEVGRVAQLYATEATFTGAMRLRVIEVGSSASGYRNSALRALNIGTNALLEQLYAQNLTGVYAALDLSGCPALEYLDASGSTFTAISFAPRGSLSEAYINAPTALSMIDLTQLTETNFHLTDGSALSSLRAENIAVDTKALVTAATGLVQARLIGIDWELNDTALLERLYSIRGMDANGLATLPHAYLAGSVFVNTISRRMFDQFRAAWPALTITYDYMPEDYAISFYNLDGSPILDSSGEPYIQYITQGEYPYDPAEDGIEDPTMPMDEQYVYTFTGWDSLTAPALADRRVTAVYSTVTRTYTVRVWGKRGGTVLAQRSELPYGSEWDLSDFIGTYTDDEANYIFNIFTGLDKSTGFIRSDLDVYCQWSRSTNYPPIGLDLSEMTPGQIYALTKYIYAGANAAERESRAAEYLAMRDHFEFTAGRDFTFENVPSVTLISIPTYLDGSTIIEPAVSAYDDGTEIQSGDLNIFSENSGNWTLAIDFEFVDQVSEATLATFGFDQDGNKGLRLRYSNGPDVQFGNVHGQVGMTSRRGIVVIRHLKGSKNIFIYANDVASVDVYSDTMLSLELARNTDPASENGITFGGIKASDGGALYPARGWIHWCKLWLDDLGAGYASKMGNWPHETWRMEYYGTGLYYYAGGSSQTTAMSFIASNILPKGHRHRSTNTNEGGWPDSEIGPFLDSRALQAVPMWVRALIKQVAVYSSEGNKSTGLTSAPGYIYIPAYRELTGSTSTPYGGEANSRIPWFVAGTDQSGNSYGENASRVKFRGQIIRKDAQIITSGSDPTALTGVTVQEGDIWINTGNSSIGYMYMSYDTWTKHRFIGVDVNTSSVIEAQEKGDATTHGKWIPASNWWERSPNVSYSTIFMNVSTYGGAGAYSSATSTYALDPCFSF